MHGYWMRAGKQITYFLVARLREFLIPEADGMERGRRDSADDLVDFGSELFARLDRCGRYGDHEARRMVLPNLRDRKSRRWSHRFQDGTSTVCASENETTR
jgi:hypothetical protein